MVPQQPPRREKSNTVAWGAAISAAAGVTDGLVQSTHGNGEYVLASARMTSAIVLGGVGGGVGAFAAVTEGFFSSAELVAQQTSRASAAFSERRLFSVESRWAWGIVLNRLNELGLSGDKVDRTHQAVLTKWREVENGPAWLPKDIAPDSDAAVRVRFLIFVSPFTEPAHLSVSSIAEAPHNQTRGSRVVVYNPTHVNKALMREIAKLIGEEGRTIPADKDARQKLLLSLLKDGANDCTRLSTPPANGKITPPRKIAISEFEVLYPATAISDHKEGTIRVEFTILEDGALTAISVLNGAQNDQLAASAVGAASLLLHEPARLNGCRVPAIITYHVRYRLER
jgi:TonB family protein